MRLIILLLIALITFPAPLFADVINDVKLKYKLSPVEKGQEAPFAGYLLNPDALAKIWSDYELLEKEKKLEIDYLTLKYEEQLSTKDKVFESNKKMYENQLNLQSTYIDKIEERILEEPFFGLFLRKVSQLVRLLLSEMSKNWNLIYFPFFISLYIL